MNLVERFGRKLRNVLKRLGRKPVATGQMFYSQHGEDVIFEYYFRWMGIARPTYLDIGACDPVALSNTYRLYQGGSRGVLVEPVAEKCAGLRADRPQDVVLNCAIRTHDMPSEIDLYVMNNVVLSTVVRRQAIYAEESREWGEGNHIKEVRSVPAITINEVLERHFPSHGVDLIDIDIEGLDFEVLQEIDFERFCPRLICVEIHSVPIEAVINFMSTKGYRLLVPIVINGIFVRK